MPDSKSLDECLIGLGDGHAALNVYIANRPHLEEYQYMETIRPMYAGEIKMIADQTGNHWRKVFNVYAKLMFALGVHLKQFDTSRFSCWQDYRDQLLLQSGSNTALLFSKPKLNTPESDDNAVHIVMGKGYFSELGFEPDDIEGMCWESVGGHGNDFAVWPDKKLIMCPYFDYRQLSNIKIDKLVECVKLVTSL